MRRSPLGPTDFAVLVATFGTSREWVYADEIRGQLNALFGFDVSGQGVVAALRRMVVEDAPRFERRADPFGGPDTYRITQWGRNEVENKLGLVTHQAAFDRSELRKALGR